VRWFLHRLRGVAPVTIHMPAPVRAGESGEALNRAVLCLRPRLAVREGYVRVLQEKNAKQNGSNGYREE
jgi:hypothetical protein